eukprot:maker-scaffold133_size323035-snap-gene-1.12 protein:Tk02240 transcript:maker-scaffold133_size323035-snap-gene-1.12-mRNA-1 annotation:"hypothetical protein JAAARDRAFT_120563"
MAKTPIDDPDDFEADQGDDEFQVGPYPSYQMGPMEIFLVFLLFVLWFYALRRMYRVWTTILNFSDLNTDSFQRNSKGWDAFIQWALEHIRGRKQSGESRRQSNSKGGLEEDKVEDGSIAGGSAAIEGVEMETNPRGDPILSQRDNKIRHHSHSIVEIEIDQHPDSEVQVQQSQV